MSGKRVLFFGLTLLALILCSACGGAIVEPTWVVGIEGADKPVFTSLEYGALAEVTVSASVTQTDGSVEAETWRGVYLRDVLKYLDVKDYSTITLLSRDDSTITLSPADIDGGAMLIIKAEGKDIEENGLPVLWVAAGEAPHDILLWNIKRLMVEP